MNMKIPWRNFSEEIMSEHPIIIDELSLHGQFTDDVLFVVLSQMRDVIIHARQSGFVSRKIAMSKDFGFKLLTSELIFSQWLFTKIKDDPFRDLKEFFRSIFSGKAFIDEMDLPLDKEFFYNDQKVIGLGYAAVSNTPCLAFPPGMPDSSLFCLYKVLCRQLSPTAELLESEKSVGIIYKKDGFAGLKQQIEESCSSGDEIFQKAWFCLPYLDFSDEAKDDFGAMRSSDNAFDKIIKHLSYIDQSIKDFHHKTRDDSRSFLEILIARCGIDNASDETDNTKNDREAKADHCCHFSSISQNRYCFLHTKYGDFKRIYFEHDITDQKARIGRIHTHLKI